MVGERVLRLDLEVLELELERDEERLERRRLEEELPSFTTTVTGPCSERSPDLRLVDLRLVDLRLRSLRLRLLLERLPSSIRITTVCCSPLWRDRLLLRP